MKLVQDDVAIKYKPAGPEMYLTDTLSRAYLPQEHYPGKADQWVERIHSVNFSVSVSEPKIQEIRAVKQSLKVRIPNGWPGQRKSLPTELRDYFRDELATQDGIIFKGLQCVIPKSPWPKSHIGIRGCLRRAYVVVYWPYMNRELKESILKCETYNTFQTAQQKEPFISLEVSQYPWEKIGCDIFAFNNRQYQNKGPLAKDNWVANKKLRNDVKREIGTAEHAFTADQIMSNTNNSSQLWKTVRSFIPKKLV